jgi:hypothetical protein
VSGSVTDSTHAVIPGAQILITNEGTLLAITTVSNPEGDYSFTFLVPGTYDLLVQAKGFNPVERKGVAVRAAQVLKLEFELTVAGATQSVTVLGAAPLLNSGSSDQLETLSRVEVSQLPESKLDWTTLLSLGSGMTRLATGSVGGVGNVLMNGLSPTTMSITADGTNSSPDPEEPSFSFYGSMNMINLVNEDAISEVSVVKGIIPASVGGTLSGNINLITKSGSDKFHGDAFELNDVAAYDARNQFLTTKPGSTFNQYGGALGGPIIKDKLFFFGSYEGARLRTFLPLSGDVPTPYLESIAPAIYANQWPLYPSMPQPAGDPTALSTLWSGASSAVQNDANTVVRGDYYISPRNQLTFRYTRSTPYQFTPSVVTANDEKYWGTSQLFNGTFVHTSGNVTSSTRFGYNELYQLRVFEGYPIDMETVVFDGISNGGAEWYQLNGGTQSYQEDLAISHGHHLFQFGGILQRLAGQRIDLNTAIFVYSTLSDFQTNVPDLAFITFDLPASLLHTWQVGGYLQDDYRLSPSLTLNLGVRYDIFTVPKERDGRIYNRGVDPSRPQLGYGFGPYRPASSVYNGDFNNVQPRVGFAWTLGSNRKTVIRGGGGVFVSGRPTFAGVVTDMASGPGIPFRSTTSRPINLAAGIGYPITENEFIPTFERMISQGFLSPNVASYSPVATNNPDPYSMQWMLGLERELGFGTVLSAAYVANRGLKMMAMWNGNLPDRVTGVQPDPTFARFLLCDPIDASSYESLQTSLIKRFSSGLMFNVNYSYSTNTSFAAGDATNEWTTYTIPDNIRGDLGPTPFSQPHMFNQSLVYQIPFARWAGAQGRAAKALIGGWQVSEILAANSGFPVNITDSASTIPSDRPDRVPGVNAILSNYRSTLQYLDASAFAKIPIVSVSGAQARPGDLGRDAFRYPAQWNLDASLAKTFDITEGVHLQLRGDFLNAFNHTNFGGLSTDLNSGSFGRFTSATARVIQLSARIQF